MTSFRAAAIAILATYSATVNGFSSTSIASTASSSSSSSLSMKNDNDRRAFLAESVFALTPASPR